MRPVISPADASVHRRRLDTAEALGDPGDGEQWSRDGSPWPGSYVIRGANGSGPGREVSWCGRGVRASVAKEQR
jgi:hypothetical protein